MTFHFANTDVDKDDPMKSFSFGENFLRIEYRKDFPFTDY